MIATRGFESLIKTLDNIAQTAEERAEAVAQYLAEEAQPEAQDRAPVDTGFLRDNITAEPLDIGHWRVISYAFYSLFQERGFMHYRDGFIPGKFFMEGAKEYTVGLVESGELRERYMLDIQIRVEPQSEDSMI